jgi:putative hydrolase of the HAD superfamily
MIKAIIFDFGRVISASRPTARFRAYETDLGIVEGTLNRLMFDSPVWQEALVGRLTLSAYWYAVGPSLGLTTHADIDAFRRRYYQDEAVNQEVLTLIRQLHGRYGLAVLSNHPPGLNQWLRDWGIRHLFDVLYCSGDEGRIKPDPAVFSITLDRLGVRPAEAVFIDDTPGHVSAAQALGIHGIAFTDAGTLGQDLERLLAEFPPDGTPPESAPVNHF